jgi:hypothetical protein
MDSELRAAPSARFQQAFTSRSRLAPSSSRGHSTHSSVSSLSSVDVYDSEENVEHPAEFELDTPALLSRPFHARTSSDPASPTFKASYKPLLLKPSASTSNAPALAAEPFKSHEEGIATTDSLLAYLTTFRKPALARTQSDTATNATSGPSQVLYKTALAQQRHKRQLSTDSITSTHSEDGKAASVTGWETVDFSHKRIVDLPVEVIRALAGSVERRGLLLLCSGPS